jgi:hypothetical protein
MQLLLVLVACVVFLIAVRAGRGRSYGVFTYRNELPRPGDDRLGRAQGLQEEDSVEPWTPPSEQAGDVGGSPSGPDHPSA